MDGMGAAAILGLRVTFAPSFMVSPGLVQKTFGARTPEAARRAALANAAALAVFAFVPAILGMAVRARLPGLANPELALPVLTADLLPPWLGALALAALFAAEISTADAVLFMLSTSLTKDLYKAFLHPEADDARLLRVGRLTTVVAGTIGVGLAIALPSVVDALKLFYVVMTVALFVPLVGGLLTARPGAGAARAAIAAAIVVTLAFRIALSGPEAAWLPYAAGIAAAAAVFAIAGRYS
jgi:SSS family solute:Na+ symporter